MVTQGQDEGSAPSAEEPWVNIVLAFLAVFAVLLGLRGAPARFWEIVLVDLTLVALVSIVVYRVETYMASQNRPTLFLERPKLRLVVVAIALGAIGGVFAEMASSVDDGSRTRAVTVYERQIQEEVMNPLRGAGEDAFQAADSLSDTDLYVRNARELSAAYHQASEVLDGIKPPRSADEGLHSLLVYHLRAVGKAYEHLASAVAKGAGTATVAAMEIRLQGSFEDLKGTEEKLAQRGYRISLPS
jgi:hypothetical protein